MGTSVSRVTTNTAVVIDIGILVFYSDDEFFLKISYLKVICKLISSSSSNLNLSKLYTVLTLNKNS